MTHSRQHLARTLRRLAARLDNPERITINVTPISSMSISQLATAVRLELAKQRRRGLT